ncbi:ATP-binding protein [Sporosarcina sp. NPDC096371]|uniref:sensor histidine kinase n=1 Tax=Sporosarcina sp. NPDC096371 TaxID=3364530 RepID=UPI003803EA0A
MKSRIVFKLFLLTTALCLLITGTIYIGQTIFFKQYYANRKVDDLTTNIQSFIKKYEESDGNIQVTQQLEQEFYRNHNAWITLLDHNGAIKTANDFYVELSIESTLMPLTDQTITIPLYHLVKVEDALKNEPTLSIGDIVELYTIEKTNNVVPFYLKQNQEKAVWINQPTWSKLRDFFQIQKEISILEDYLAKYNYLEEKNSDIQINRIIGNVINVQLPDINNVSSTIYNNSLFMDRINEFQTNLLFNRNDEKPGTIKTLDFQQNDIKYKIFIDTITDRNGETNYIFAMASLQPVDEAVQMVKDYYVYIIVFVLLLTLLASFYFSIKIARPLLKINNTTKKIANLDFTERIEYHSNDEIGDLSKNINLLSNTLHAHIEQLNKDIEKEKQLEYTRKEFISGVSHELKTPLSIMKSCISILNDGVASHKKDYYFEALDKEVDKMDHMIVDMLELAKFESGTYKMKMETFYIDEAIKQIYEGLLMEITKKQLQVYMELSNVEVIANQQRIKQVITNFVINAIRYTPEKEAIFITTIEEDKQVKICIENKGTSISSDQIDKIWDRFYRGDMSRHRSEGGTGLGLAISKNILELHGMEYGVSNTEDGVLFFFYINKKI